MQIENIIIIKKTQQAKKKKKVGKSRIQTEAWWLEESGPRKNGKEFKENLPPFFMKMNV